MAVIGRIQHYDLLSRLENRSRGEDFDQHLPFFFLRLRSLPFPRPFEQLSDHENVGLTVLADDTILRDMR